MHQDYRAFYEEEIGYRKLLGYPPVSNLLAIHGSCGNEELLETGIYIKQEDHQLLLRAKSRLEQYIEVNSGFREIRIQLDFNH